MVSIFFKLPLKIKPGFGLLKKIMRMITNLYKKNMHACGFKNKKKLYKKIIHKDIIFNKK